MTNLNLEGRAATAEEAEKEVAEKIGNTNKRLTSAKLPTLETPASSAYSVHVRADKTPAADDSYPLEATFQSPESFADAEAIARKVFGKNPFSTDLFEVTIGYEVTEQQLATTRASQRPPAGPLYGTPQQPTTLDRVMNGLR